MIGGGARLRPGRLPGPWLAASDLRVIVPEV